MLNISSVAGALARSKAGSTENVHITEVDCNGNENMLINCTYQSFNVQQGCVFSLIAQVRCLTEQPTGNYMKLYCLSDVFNELVMYATC